MKRNFSLTLISVFLILLVTTCGSESRNAKNQLPNIILILADDMGYGDIGAFNPNSKIRTPYLDKLAEEGIIFTDAHSSSSVCTPTRYGILTGRYSWRTRLKSGVLSGTSPGLIDTDLLTIASLLSNHSYQTGVIGKWHLGMDWTLKHDTLKLGTGWNKNDFEGIDFSERLKVSPNDLGFDNSYIIPASLDMAPYVYVENGISTEIPTRFTVNKAKYSWWREGPTASDFIHEETNPHLFEKAHDFISEQSQKPNPFFLYLPLPSPHTPILPTEQWQGKSGLNPYADFVMMIDDLIGEMMNQLEELGIANSTMIIFTSDNGCSPAAGITELQDMGHFPSGIYRGHKADIFEGGHRVPFIVRWPERVNTGLKSNHMVNSTDFVATFSELVGYQLGDGEGVDSYSFFDLLTEDSNPGNSRTNMISHSINGNFAIRRGPWKFISTSGSGGWSFPTAADTTALDTLPDFQLYNLESDPGESNNLVRQYPELANELKQLLRKQIREGRSTPGPTQKNDKITIPWHQIEF